jgi:hypothetical protein
MRSKLYASHYMVRNVERERQRGRERWKRSVYPLVAGFSLIGPSRTSEWTKMIHGHEADSPILSEVNHQPLSTRSIGTPCPVGMGGQVILHSNEGAGQSNALDTRMDDASWPELEGCSGSNDSGELSAESARQTEAIPIEGTILPIILPLISGDSRRVDPGIWDSLGAHDRVAFLQ